MASIGVQLRQLVPAKVSEDDKLIEYDAHLLYRSLDIIRTQWKSFSLIHNLLHLRLNQDESFLGTQM